MSSAVYNSFPIAGYTPLLKRTIDNQSTNLLFKDNYPTIFERMGILRDEMMVMTKAYTLTDPLTGILNYRYIDEDTSIPDETKLKPIDNKKQLKM